MFYEASRLLLADNSWREFASKQRLRSTAYRPVDRRSTRSWLLRNIAAGVWIRSLRWTAFGIEQTK
jgi:hypothetical protein